MRLQKTTSDSRQPQYYCYLPSKIVQAFGWKKGDPIEIEIMGKDKIKLERKKPGAEKHRGDVV